MKWVERDAHSICERLQGYLAKLAIRFPQIWSRVDDMRAYSNWPSWCFLPLSASYYLASQGRYAENLDHIPHWIRKNPVYLAAIGMKDLKDIDDPTMNKNPLWIVRSEISALAAWRPTQGIYRFHPELFPALRETPLEGDIPVELLYRLPEWCCYIDCYERHIPYDYDPDLPLAGFFAHLACDDAGGNHQLTILLDVGIEQQHALVPYILNISGRKNIADMFVGWMDDVELTMPRTGKKVPEDFTRRKRLYAQRCARTVRPLISLILYLCSTTREFRDARGTYSRPTKAKPTKTKRGERIFAPDHPTIWETGYLIGHLMQQYHAERIHAEGTGEGTHASPVPHIRKPHWHAFWKGPKDDPKKRELILHWLPPIPVGYKPGGPILPTIHPVK